MTDEKRDLDNDLTGIMFTCSLSLVVEDPYYRGFCYGILTVLAATDPEREKRYRKMLKDKVGDNVFD